MVRGTVTLTGIWSSTTSSSGPGAAGCVVAGRLAAAAARPSVLLIEYGGRARNPLLHVPKGFYYTLRGDRYLYRYLTQPGQRRAARHEVWLRGRVLGGSAAVNGMMWMRGAPADWDGLAARGNPGWSWADVLPAYLAMEDHSLGARELRGAGGPLGVTVTDAGDEVTAAILASAVEYGWEQVADANASDTERIGSPRRRSARGRRTTSYDAFVRPSPGQPARPVGSLTVAHQDQGRLACSSTAAASPASGPRSRRARPRRHGPPRGDRLRGHGGDAAAARAVRHRPPRRAPRSTASSRGRVAERRRARHRAARRRAAGDAQAGPGRRQQAQHAAAARRRRPCGTCDRRRACSRPAATTWSASSSRTRTGPARTSRACSSRWPRHRRART